MTKGTSSVQEPLAADVRQQIASNLAEGAGRNGTKEFLHFIGIARGSLAELETQLQLAVMLNFAPQDHVVFELVDRTGKLLTGLHKKLNLP
jgi:four helix bundle protein